jgi:hypothetical protein
MFITGSHARADFAHEKYNVAVGLLVQTQIRRFTEGPTTTFDQADEGFFA